MIDRKSSYIGKPVGTRATKGVNPKDILAAKKVDLSLLPAAAIVEAARAMGNGAAKYGPYNWREKPVRARVYVAAAMRHLLQWLEGESAASDSGAHHLGHAMACCAILIDAEATKCLADDRPVPRCEDVERRLNVAPVPKRRPRNRRRKEK